MEQYGSHVVCRCSTTCSSNVGSAAITVQHVIARVQLARGAETRDRSVYKPCSGYAKRNYLAHRHRDHSVKHERATTLVEEFASVETDLRQRPRCRAA